MSEERLRNAITAAIDGLAGWLLDNTEGGFEEEAEIDSIRTALQEALDD